MENKYILITPGERKLLRDSYQMSKSNKTKTWRIQSFLIQTHRHRHTLLQYNLFVTVFKLHVCVWHSSHECMLPVCRCMFVSASCTDDVDRTNRARWELTLISWIMRGAPPVLFKSSINNKKTGHGAHGCAFIVDSHTVPFRREPVCTPCNRIRAVIEKGVAAWKED